MTSTTALTLRDARFRAALAAFDAGDEAALRRVLAEHPGLGAERLEEPGAWLREQVGEALDGYFRRPFLLWFAAGNPVRGGRLPPNAASLAAILIEAARRDDAEGLRDQLEHTLELVASGRVARESGVQIALLDVLIDAGARPGDGLAALGAGHLQAAAHLLERGGTLGLAGALCLGRFDEAPRLAAGASAGERQDALIAAAVNARPDAQAWLLAFGVDVDARGSGIHPHATALHQAVAAGCLPAVQRLVEAGARLDVRDTVHRGTPLDWARYAGQAQIASYLEAAGERR
ncbi:ankyrin repeat domain-containing protein [Dokdonella ginsengisoli]|uniref:Ankyrin repeat domain-containing protein n=1 Tax=Dokdonella ginsengisoli TaxID=363846 RepID=A0ABV9QS87_9GAMM